MNAIMFFCWRKGYKTKKIIETFEEAGYSLSESDVLSLFKQVANDYFMYMETK